MEEIVKTRAKLPKTYGIAWGCRDIAKKIWGDLKVADSFLYLYRRFGTPCADTNEEYKISYEYNFKYRELYFIICATTPEFVYLDCYYPAKYGKLQQERFGKEASKIFDKASADGILLFPYKTPDCTWEYLTKKQRVRYNTILDNEAVTLFGKETFTELETWVRDRSVDDENEKYLGLFSCLYDHLFEKFWAWAAEDKDIFSLYRTGPDLRFLPEVEEIIREFCHDMLTTKPIRDCDINIRGWQ